MSGAKFFYDVTYYHGTVLGIMWAGVKY